MYGSGTCGIDHRPVLSFIGSAPGGMAEQQSDQRPLMQGEVISGKAPHCPPSLTRETRQRDAPSTSRFNLITLHLRGLNSNCDLKKKKGANLAPHSQESVTL